MMVAGARNESWRHDICTVEELLCMAGKSLGKHVSESLYQTQEGDDVQLIGTRFEKLQQKNQRQ